MRDWQKLIRPGETVSRCKLCMTDSVVKGDGTGRMICVRCGTLHDPKPYREELTEAGPQLVMPGCERIAPDNGKPHQLGLF